MATERPRFGHRIIARVADIKGNCSWGHSVGQEMDVSCHDTGGICGLLYHAMFPSLSVLQFGGAFPWGEEDVVEVECPDRYNAVKLQLRRIRE